MNYDVSINDLSYSVPSDMLLNHNEEISVIDEIQTFHNELRSDIRQYNSKRATWQHSNLDLLNMNLLDFEENKKVVKKDINVIDVEVEKETLIYDYEDDRRYEVMGVLHRNQYRYGSPKYHYNYGIDLKDNKVADTETKLYYNIVDENGLVTFTPNSINNINDRLSTINNIKKL